MDDSGRRHNLVDAAARRVGHHFCYAALDPRGKAFFAKLNNANGTPLNSAWKQLGS